MSASRLASKISTCPESHVLVLSPQSPVPQLYRCPRSGGPRPHVILFTVRRDGAVIRVLAPSWRSGLPAVNSITSFRPSPPAIADMHSLLQTPFRVRPYHAIVSVIVASLFLSEQGLAQSEGSFLRVRVDDARNRAILEVPAAQVGKDFLHQVTLTTGLGVSNGPGLDRGQTGSNAVVRLERRG